MTTADECRAMFPEVKDDDWSYSLSYQELIRQFGSIEIDASDADYSGNSYLLLRAKDGRPGFLTYGWGSCSGCDEMQACDSAQDVANLFDRLRASVQWFDDDGAARAWFAAHDWEGEFSWHDGVGSFITAINEKYGLAIATPEKP